MDKNLQKIDIPFAYVDFLLYLCSGLYATRMMSKLFSDYTISAQVRYEAHTLIYAREDGDPIRFGGILAAAVFSVLIADTDEGDRRGIVLDTEAQRNAWYDAYEHETRRENGGLLSTEVQSLKEAYVELTSSDNALSHICQNDRLYDLAVGLMDGYMQRLVREQVCEQIYEVHPWHEPFAQWLFDAGFIESWRQDLLAINWTNPAEVFTLAEKIINHKFEIINNQSPTFLFDGLSADQLLNGYWEWLWGEVQKQANLYPDANVRLAELKKTVLAQETDYDFLRPDLQSLAPDQLTLFRNWMARWKEFLTRKIKPQKEISFWTKNVTVEQQEALLDYLKFQERQPQRFKCLAVAVYSMRQLGYITYNISESSIAKWLSERLQNDYSSKTGLYQFRRAWRELGRYTPAVQAEVEHLAELGVKAI